MSVEKKLWQFPTPFRRFSGKQDLPLNAKPGPSRSRVSSVYLSDDSSSSDFIIVPEFDDPTPSPTAQGSSDTSHTSRLPVTIPSNPLAPISYSLMNSQHDSCLDNGSGNISVNTGRNDDLSQRLDSAYAHIHAMPSAPSPRVSLSSDPQILRKELGVPQHSVLNYPNHSSLDLPNPHNSPEDPTTTFPCEKTPKNPGLRINTIVYPSPLAPFSDSFQHTQTRTVVATSAPTESSLQCATSDERATGTQNSRTTIPNSPTPASKRRDVISTVSPSSPPCSRRQVLRNVLRKPAASSPSLTSAYRRQVSLPEIRPPSPFRVDIPLHHTWHNRRTAFHSSTDYHSRISQSHEAKSRRTSGSTEVLASLAWIGTPPMTSSPHFDRSASPTCFPEHFRMAIAVEDDSISDDVLVDRLEKVRKIGSPSERSREISSSCSSGIIDFSSVGRDKDEQSYTSLPSPRSPTPDQLGEPYDVLLPSPSGSEDAAVWQAARKAVLCIREIVRTEKKYQEALKMLLNAQTATPPPPAMIPHVSALVRASETLLKHFLEDPSAWGVSTAFVTSEDELETTMVSWCAVAGTFFTNGRDHDPQSSSSTSKWRLRKSAVVLNSSPTVMKQVSTPLSPQLPPIFPAFNTADKIKERSLEDITGLHSCERLSVSLSLQKPDTDSHALTNQPPGRKLSVRDLAIQPIQRVMRYVLLYRDLLDSTPPASPSHLLVERALEAATRIARHCDRAQRNPAFFHNP